MGHTEREPELDPLLCALTHYRRRGPGADFEILVTLARARYTEGCASGASAPFWVPWTLLVRNAAWRARLEARWSVWDAQRALGEHQCNVPKPLRGLGARCKALAL